MKSKVASELHRGEKVRNRWQGHALAQRASGQTQVAYCRAHGLDPSYFSMWKRKLAAVGAGVSAPRDPALRLVPLVVRTTVESQENPLSTAEPICIHVMLRNGLSVSLRASSLNGIRMLLNELSQLPC